MTIETIMQFIKVLFSFAMLCVVLLLSYYGTKWLGKRLSFKSTSKYMEIVDKLYVDRDKVITIVRFQNTYKAIAMSSNAISDLGSIDIVEEDSLEEEEKDVFAEVLAKYQQITQLRKQKKAEKTQTTKLRSTDDEVQ